MSVKRVAVLIVAGSVAFAIGFGGSEMSKAMQLAETQAEGGVQEHVEATQAVPEAVDPDVAPSYVDAGRIVVPVMRNGRTTNYVVASIRLETDGDAASQRIAQRLPTVRNALLQSLYGMASGGRFETDAVRLAEISTQLAQDIGGISGGGVRAVLFDQLVTSSPT